MTHALPLTSNRHNQRCGKQSLGHRIGLGILALCLPLAGAMAVPTSGDPPPLSAAQTALFDTPHLGNVAAAETLRYRFERTGGDPLTDTVDEQILEIHPNGRKLVGFNFLSGDHHEFYPAVDDFAGNPILMIYLEHDVRKMKDQIGIAAAYFRDRFRDALVDRAVVTPTTFVLDGKSHPAKRITVQPFSTEQRLEHVPSLRDKTYEFVVCDDAPGQLVELGASMPADPSTGAPAWSERLTFTGETK